MTNSQGKCQWASPWTAGSPESPLSCINDAPASYLKSQKPPSAWCSHRRRKKRPRTVHEHIARRRGERARDPVEIAREVDLAAEARRVGQAEGHVEHVILIVLIARDNGFWFNVRVWGWEGAYLGLGQELIVLG